MAVMESSRARGVDRVIAMFRQLHIAQRPMSIRELIEATGAPRSSIYELVAILAEVGWLESTADGSVFFGREMHYYGSDYATHNDLISRAHQSILALVRKHEETAQLCMLEGNKYTVVLSENSARPFNISSDIGVRVPIPWTATGRLLARPHERRRDPRVDSAGRLRSGQRRSYRLSGIHARCRACARLGLLLHRGTLERVSPMHGRARSRSRRNAGRGALLHDRPRHDAGPPAGHARRPSAIGARALSQVAFTGAGRTPRAHAGAPESTALRNASRNRT